MNVVCAARCEWWGPQLARASCLIQDGEVPDKVEAFWAEVAPTPQLPSIASYALKIDACLVLSKIYTVLLLRLDLVAGSLT